jgi:hypothetical protein
MKMKLLAFERARLCELRIDLDNASNLHRAAPAIRRGLQMGADAQVKVGATETGNFLVPMI